MPLPNGNAGELHWHSDSVPAANATDRVSGYGMFGIPGILLPPHVTRDLRSGITFNETVLKAPGVVCA